MYLRFGIFKLEEVLPYIILDANKLPKVSDRGKLLYKSFIGYKVKMNVRNLQLFALKGTRCSNCGREGAYFALELQTNHHPKQNYCFNLYSINNTIFTKDHIIPISKGGSNALENLQTMCIVCNGKKADKASNQLYVRGALKVDFVHKIKNLLPKKKYKLCKAKAERATQHKSRPLHIKRRSR